mgnify:CR=1 FL=1
MISDISIVLPSYKPDEKLEETVESFHNAGFEDIIVVDDGGGSEFRHIFERVEKLPYCTVLTHEVNCGKGAALKTAYKYYWEKRKGIGCICADGDGQHLASDALGIAETMRNNYRMDLETVVLGVRDFNGPDVPPRSRTGNKITSGVFKTLIGMKVSDTQTGFRGIPTKYIPYMVCIKGERYEYETNMLMYMKRWGIPYEEIGITTVYLDDNKRSHFNPVKDSVRIYGLIFKFILTGVFFKYIANSMGCFVLDFIIYLLSQKLFLSLYIETAIAVALAYFCGRGGSSIVNFLINRKIFEGDKNKRTAVRYFALVIALLILGTFLASIITEGIASLFMIEESMTQLLSSIVKVIVDAGLFVISYNVQKNYVFRKESSK